MNINRKLGWVRKLFIKDTVEYAMKGTMSLILMLGFLSGNTQSGWSILEMVQFEKRFDENFGMELLYPSFSPAVLQLDGKEIEVNGYFIPLNGKSEQNHFMLSKYPESTCFFCGKAGPESAAQVFLKDGRKQAYSNEKIRVKGILRINKTDPTGLLYTLEQASATPL